MRLATVAEVKPIRLPPRRVGADELLVDVGAPARPIGQYEVAVFDDRCGGDDVVLPGHIVDVDLHDFEVRHNLE